MVTCDIRDQITVLIDGGAGVHPDDVTFNGVEMDITMATPFTTGQVVTWAYDDTGVCDLQSISTPHQEANNQTHSVVNLVPVHLPHSPWVDEHGANWEDSVGAQWRV